MATMKGDRYINLRHGTTKLNEGAFYGGCVRHDRGLPNERWEDSDRGFRVFVIGH